MSFVSSCLLFSDVLAQRFDKIDPEFSDKAAPHCNCTFDPTERRCIVAKADTCVKSGRITRCGTPGQHCPCICVSAPKPPTTKPPSPPRTPPPPSLGTCSCGLPLKRDGQDQQGPQESAQGGCVQHSNRCDPAAHPYCNYETGHCGCRCALPPPTKTFGICECGLTKKRVEQGEEEIEQGACNELLFNQCFNNSRPTCYKEQSVVCGCKCLQHE